MSAKHERDTAIDKLRASGSDRSGRIALARAAGDGWMAIASRSSIDARIGPWECYGGGCAATIVHKAEAGIDDLTNEIAHSEEFRRWDGPKLRSGPIERPDGTVEITWLLLLDRESK
jgi:hypothetical protein